MMAEEVKTAIITGANKGIGFETARQLAIQGMKVYVAGRDEARVSDAVETLSDEGLNVQMLQIDVTSDSSVSSAAKKFNAQNERLDVLVNNAAIRIEKYGLRPSQQPLEDWHTTFETNIFGTVRVTCAFLPALRRSSAGRIVNVSSLLGSIETHSDPTSYAYSDMFKSLPAYSASKSAVNSWTAHLAYELRDTPIKVNSVHPGYTKTDMNDGDGELDVKLGATTSVRMATLSNGGPSGSYAHFNEIVPW